MKHLKLDNNLLCLSEYGSWVVYTYISLEDIKSDIVIEYSDTNSITDENCYEMYDDKGKKLNLPLIPFNRNLWFIDKWYYRWKLKRYFNVFGEVEI